MVTDVFDSINLAKNTLNGIIDGLQGELDTANRRIQTLDTDISKAQGMIEEYERSKQSCLINMAYYRRFMD